MAVGSLQSGALGPLPAFQAFSGSMTRLRARAAGSETWARGSVLIQSSGLAAEASADPVAAVLGIADHSATSTSAGDMVYYYPAYIGWFYEMTFEDQSNEDHVLANADFYDSYAMQVDTDGIWYMDENDNTATSITLYDVRLPSVVGDTRARVLGQFQSDVTVWGVT